MSDKLPCPLIERSSISCARRANYERDPQNLIKEGVHMPKLSVFSEGFTVISGEHDDGVSI